MVLTRGRLTASPVLEGGEGEGLSVDDEEVIIEACGVRGPSALADYDAAERQRRRLGSGV